jgi:hypothetical protein
LAANETTSNWRITKNWDQGTDEDKFFGGLANFVSRTSAGTISVSAGEVAIVGVGTSFTSASVGDEVHFDDATNPYWATVKTITDNTNMTVTAAAPAALAGASFEIFSKDVVITPSSTAGRKL